MNKNRIVSMDIARGLCVVWIVGIWHMNQYLVPETKLFSDTNRLPFLMITNGVLALFTFLSGFFISQKKIESIADAWDFYRKRVIRFGIPLLVSCVLLMGGGFSPLHIITTCLGISQFLPPPYPKTLWYFSMIIAFYYVTPLLCYAKQKSGYLSVVVSVYLLLLLYIGNLYLGFDRRLYENFIFYAIPFAIPCSHLIKLLQSKWSFFLILAVSLVTVIIFYNSMVECGADMMVVSDLFISLGILSLASILATVPRLPVVFYYLSYASMFAYLYHRELYIVATKIIGKFNYFEAASFGILLFVLSYYGQRIYDKTINKISK